MAACASDRRLAGRAAPPPGEIRDRAGRHRPARLEWLRGRTLNLSEIGSGTYNLAREVLAFAGLQTPADYTPATLSYRELLDMSDRAKLPDAVFTVSALPSPVARHLITHRGYRLVPLQFGEAFALDSLQGRSPPTASSGRTPFGVDRAHVYNAEIPAYTYSVSPPEPPRPIATFGTRLLMVAHADVPDEAVVRLLDAAYGPSPSGLALDPALLDLTPELDWHEGTLAYRERNKPVIIGDVVDFLEKSTSLLGGLLGGGFFLWHWNRQRRRRRRDSGFESYMMKVTALENRALELETAAART